MAAIPGPQIPLMAPGQAMWMTRPPPHPNCPPGLEFLLQVDSLHMKQLPSFVEALTGWDTNNKYIVSNSSGIQIYYAAEKSDTCMRMCCGPQREFTIHIVDYSGQEVFRVYREFKCCAGTTCFAGCCDCCAHEIVISTPNGQVLGYVKQVGSCLGVKYHILDENHQPILRLHGPVCILDGPCCPCDNEFKLLAMQTDDQIGSLKKIYAGFFNEMVSTADRFGISFPVDLHVNAKATLLGALFLIDFMLFENKQNNNSNY